VDYFYKNADCDEMIFVHKGSGTLRTFLGNARLQVRRLPDDPPRDDLHDGIQGRDNRLFIVESHRPMYTPKRYRNYFGQLLEHSPFCERDIRRPKKLETHDEKGDFVIKVKKQNLLHEFVYATHPFRRGGLGRLQLSLRLQHPRLRAHHRPRTPAAARPPDLRDETPSWCAASARASTTTTRRPSPRRTTTATSTATRCSTTWTATS
jgi:hypothetical protein